MLTVRIDTLPSCIRDSVHVPPRTVEATKMRRLPNKRLPTRYGASGAASATLILDESGRAVAGCSSTDSTASSFGARGH